MSVCNIDHKTSGGLCNAPQNKESQMGINCDQYFLVVQKLEESQNINM